MGELTTGLHVWCAVSFLPKNSATLPFVWPSTSPPSSFSDTKGVPLDVGGAVVVAPALQRIAQNNIITEDCAAEECALATKIREWRKKSTVDRFCMKHKRTPAGQCSDCASTPNYSCKTLQ